MRGFQHLPRRPAELGHEPVARVQIFHRAFEEVPEVGAVGAVRCGRPRGGADRLGATVFLREQTDHGLILRQLRQQREKLTEPPGTLLIGEINLRPTRQL